jgi:carbon starvation protein CstA
MYASVIWGDWGPLHAFNTWMAAAPMWAWVVGLLAYAYIASVLPVWVLLQPRDYINSLQLITALGLLVVGLAGAAIWGGVSPIPAEGGGVQRIPLEMVAPNVNWHPEGAPPMIPLLFITIACGAISGFHCLVSSGTTSKQLKNECDAQAVGYGSMLTEGFLATLVIISCAAGIGLGVDRPLVWQIGTPSEESVVAQQETGWQGTMFNIRDSNAESRNIPAWISSHLGTERMAPQLNSRTYASIDEYLQDVSDSLNGPPIAAISTVQDTKGAIVIDSGEEVFALTGALAFNKQYESWGAAGSLGAKVGAFVDGSANLIKSIGVPAGVAVALMGVLVASFAGTTMDTACRLQRYVIQELARTFLPRPVPNSCVQCGYSLAGLPADANCPECDDANEWRLDFSSHPEELDAPALEHDVIERHASVWNPFRWLATRHGATSLAVVSAILLAFIPAPGQTWSLANAGAGGLILWPMFGATNQLLGGLAFIVIAVWLIATKRPWWFLAFPAGLMLVLPAWALIWQTFVGNEGTPAWVANGDWVLTGVAVFMLAMEAWLVIEVIARARSGKINETLLRGITTDSVRAGARGAV